MKFVINLVTPDNGEKYLVEMSNATLTNIKGVQAKNPDLTITLNRTDLDLVMMGASTFDDLIKAGKAKFEGDRKPYEQLKAILVAFTPDFEILPGTAAASGATPPARIRSKSAANRRRRAGTAGTDWRWPWDMRSGRRRGAISRP